MKSQQTIRDIVGILGTSSEEACPPESFFQAGHRTWRRVLEWLDASGLALYFLDRIKQRQIQHLLPSEVLLELEQRRRNNCDRTLRLRTAFDFVNRLFTQAGVKYAALKGFALVPEYCQDASLRPQCDLDFFVDPDSFDVARHILTGQGYVLKEQTGKEYSYWMPAAVPRSSSQQYDPQSPYLIELHLALWEHGLGQVPITMRQVSVERLISREWDGIVYPSLSESEVFLGQVLHAFRHFAEGWMKLSWLLEISHFLKSRRDRSFWTEIQKATASDAGLREIIATITGFTTQLFGEPHPAAACWKSWLNPTLQRWVDHYSREWLLDCCPGFGTRLFSRAKLRLFLSEYYRPSHKSSLRVLRRSLFPAEGLQRLIRRRKRGSSPAQVILETCVWLTSHFSFHIGSTLRYFWELPRWRALSRQEGDSQQRLQAT